MRTTVDLPDYVFKRAKSRATVLRISLNEFLSGILASELTTAGGQSHRFWTSACLAALAMACDFQLVRFDGGLRR